MTNFDSHLKDGRGVKQEALDIIHYVTIPNLINTANDQVGTVYRISPKIPKRISVNQYLMYTFDTHNLEHIIAVFDPKTGMPQQRELVLDWPKLDLAPTQNLISKLTNMTSLTIPNALSLLTDSEFRRLLGQGLKSLFTGSNFPAMIGGAEYAAYFQHVDAADGYQPNEEKLTFDENYFVTFCSHYEVKPDDMQIIALVSFETSIKRFLYLYHVLRESGFQSQLAKCTAKLPQTAKTMLAAFQLDIPKDTVTGEAQKETAITTANVIIDASASCTAYDFRRYITNILSLNPDVFQAVESLHKDKFKHIYDEVDELRHDLEKLRLSLPVVADCLPETSRFYIERTAYMNQLQTLFKEHGLVIAGITGESGCGKSQLATEYAHQSQQTQNSYNLIRWLKADNQSNLKNAFFSLGDDLGISRKDYLTDPDPEAAFKEAIFRKLLQYERVLLIYDYVENLNDFELFKPKAGGRSTIHVILTSRQSMNDYPCIQAKPFDDNDILNFVKKKFGNDINFTTEDAAKLGKTVGYLPYNIVQTIGGMNPTAFLSMVLNNRKQFFSPTTSHHSITTIGKLSAPALNCLYLCSFLDPDNIPKTLLSKFIAGYSTNNATPNQIDPNKALSELRTLYFLTDVGTDYCRIHRLAQENVQQQLLKEDPDQQKAKGIIERAIDALTLVIQEDKNKPQGEIYLFWKECDFMALQVSRLLTEAKRLNVDTSRFKALNDWMEDYERFISLKDESQSNNGALTDLSLYVPPKGDTGSDCQNPQPMEQLFQEFLDDKDAKVMLLLGDSGSGKTLYGKYLSRKASHYKRTPLWIHLPSIKNPVQTLMEEGLQLQGVAGKQYQVYQQKPLLVILDDYDEAQISDNLYKSNHLENWNVKVIITCRTNYVTPKNYSELFKPTDGTYIKRYLAPFSEDDVSSYLQNFITTQQSNWDMNQYQSVFDQFPELKRMVETPFLLKIIVAVLPEVTQNLKDAKNRALLTRKILYEAFINQWFEKHLKTWETENKLPILDEGLPPGTPADLHTRRMKALCNYAQDFALALYKASDNGSPTMSDTSNPLLATDPRTTLIRSACPLKKTGNNVYSFVHQSLLDYFVTASPNALTFERLDKPILSSTIIQFLADSIIDNPTQKAQLWSFVLGSRQSLDQTQVAANAISILNRALESFSGLDLSWIRITGADLSGGIFDTTNLQNANLSKVNFTGAWLHGANFTNAVMTNVTLGEYPSILNQCSTGCYSPDGKYFALASKKSIQVYDTATRELIFTFDRHKRKIKSICFTPDGKQLVSAGDDNCIRFSSISTGEQVHKITHTTAINSVQCCSQPDIIAFADANGIVTVRHTSTSQVLHTVPGNLVEFSPDGETLATSQKNGDIILWSVASGTITQTFKGHTQEVTSLRFSPNGEDFASASRDCTIKLWSLDTGQVSQTLKGHSLPINAIQFRKNGKVLASGSEDKTVKLWSIPSGALLKTLEGHRFSINDIEFNPKGKILATMAESVKFWPISEKGFLET